MQKPTHRERAFLNPKHSAPGNMTLEAALMLPLFLLVILSILYFLVIMDFQLKLQMKLEAIARETARTQYLGEEIPGYAYLKLMGGLSSPENGKWLENSFISGGSSGLGIAQSDFSVKDGVIDYVVNYEIQIPFIPDRIMTLPFVQRCRFRTWTGSSLSAEGEDGQQVVYVTPGGAVYHMDPCCTHINLSIQKRAIYELEELRNAEGGIYTECSLCEEGEVKGETVYVTEEGDRWHYTLSCSGLKRNVIEIDIGDAGDRRLCSRCGKEE
ncbi:TadE/TadG family type IV pilus assembly protein [Parasporobacterium paucivorans]|uniref:TadE/TadG family type IV pilus assembly protein n=1 Tax=Parasporobacterium paucivorans TaxID=115544 RepID=UPI001A9A3840|nr:TadE family protein [Parasporobacterium paucivorans]